MFDSPWNSTYLIGFVVYVATRHIFERRVQGTPVEASEVDGVEKGLLTLVMVGALLLPVLYLFTPLLSFADYAVPAPLHWLGLGAMLVALWLFWRSHADLATNWSRSLELRVDHELVTRGVYGRIRHPMYAAISIWSIAQGLLLDNWLAGWSALATFLPLLLIRTPREERMMLRSFGPAYEDYMRRTGKLLPRWPSRPPAKSER